jgi:translation elongation factor P/translation initiation factor 5A
VLPETAPTAKRGLLLVKATMKNIVSGAKIQITQRVSDMIGDNWHNNIFKIIFRILEI